MSDIREKLTTNPELLKLNREVGKWLEDCIATGYGEGKLEVKIQGGKIVHVYKGVTTSVELRNLSPQEQEKVKKYIEALDKNK